MGLLEEAEPALLRSHAQLAADLGALLGDPTTADVTFALPAPDGRGEVEMVAHSLILKARSEYFQTVLRAGMTEAHDRRIALPEMPPEVFRRFLEYVYTGTLQLTPVVALQLYHAGDKFLMEDLKRLCLHFLWGYLDNTNIVALLCEAHALGMEPKFINLLLSYTAGHIGEILQEDFNALPPELVVSLLQYGSLSAREADILTLVCAWASHSVERDLAEQAAALIQSAWRHSRAQASVHPTPIGFARSASVAADEGPRGVSGPPSPAEPAVKLEVGSSEADAPAATLRDAITSAMATQIDAAPHQPAAAAPSSSSSGPGPSLAGPRFRRRRLALLRALLAQPLRYIRFSLINQKDLAKLAEKAKVRIITDAVTDTRYAPDVLSGGRRTSSSVVQLQVALQRERTEKNFEYNAFKFKVVLVKSDATLGLYLHFQYYTYPALFVINAQGISISLLSWLHERKKKTRTLDNKIGLGRFGLGYKAFITAAEFPEYLSPNDEVRVEVDFPFYNGRKLRLVPHDDGSVHLNVHPPSVPNPTSRTP